MKHDPLAILRIVSPGFQPSEYLHIIAAPATMAMVGPSRTGVLSAGGSAVAVSGAVAGDHHGLVSPAVVTPYEECKQEGNEEEYNIHDPKGKASFEHCAVLVDVDREGAIDGDTEAPEYS